jgi:hypothetical protein
MRRLAIMLCFSACGEPPEMVAPPSVALHNQAPLIPPPPPPPPPPRGLRPDEPGEVPPALADYIAAHPTANAILFDPASLVKRRALGQARAALIMIVLADPVSWDDGEQGCVTDTIALRFSDGGAPFDLELDSCNHVDLIGFNTRASLKSAARARLWQLLGQP